MPWVEVQRIHDLRKRAAEHGTPLNWVADIHSHDEALVSDDARCKRWLANKAKTILQAVRGRGKTPRQETVAAVTVYEKRLGGDLHAHLWLHVAKGNDALQRFHDGHDINVHRAHWKTPYYLTKTRAPKGDEKTEQDFVRRTGLQRQGGQAPFRGSRVTFSADALALLHAVREDAPEAAAPAPRPVLKVINNALTPVERQLSLLPERAVTRLRDFAHGVMPRAVAHEVEVRRRWLGLTQGQVAAAGGLSRPQLVNALKGRFGLSEWTAARLRNFLLHGERLAA